MTDATLLIIDPQQDFMGEDDGSPYTIQVGGHVDKAALPVPGALTDMRRAADMVDRARNKISGIHVTLCAHHRIEVGHPGFWRNPKGESPTPIMLISKTDIMEGRWYPRDPRLLKEMVDYATVLEENSQYQITVWHEHCLIGTWGQCVQTNLAKSIERWEHATYLNADYVLKGGNTRREHYGALMAEVGDPKDHSTQLNVRLLNELKLSAGPIGVFGEASSQCVMATIQQIADHIGDEHLHRLYLIVDCMSPIPAIPDGPNYPEIADAFMSEMLDRGMHLGTAQDFLDMLYE